MYVVYVVYVVYVYVVYVMYVVYVVYVYVVYVMYVMACWYLKPLAWRLGASGLSAVCMWLCVRLPAHRRWSGAGQHADGSACTHTHTPHTHPTPFPSLHACLSNQVDAMVTRCIVSAGPARCALTEY